MVSTEIETVRTLSDATDPRGYFTVLISRPFKEREGVWCRGVKQVHLVI